MTTIGREERFGCERCCPESAKEAWDASRKFLLEADLIDESHFHVMIRACPACSQPYLSVFTEKVDLADGEDPQSWLLTAITGEEATDLQRRAGSLTGADLDGLVASRRCLQRDSPKGERTKTFWASGASVGAHD